MKVVICGGGMMGCSTAYHLTLKGVPPTVVERCGIACAASGKAGGFLAKDWCDSSPVGPLARKSFQLHAELADTFPNCDYRKLDTLSLSAKEGAKAKKGSSVDWLDGPVLSQHTIGTTKTTAQVHPRKLVENMFGAAQAKGAKLQIGTVEGLEFSASKDKVTGVKVDGGVIPADVVVIAMGPWSKQACQWLPIPEIESFRGHSITLIPEEPVTPHALFTEVATKADLPRDPEFYPRPDGEVYICGMGDAEKLPDDPSAVVPNMESCAALHKQASLLSSRFQSAKVGTQQVCHIPYSPDGVPLIGKVPGVTGAFIAAGHGVWGILNGPATGAALAELIVDGQTSLLDLSPFDPARFS